MSNWTYVVGSVSIDTQAASSDAMSEYKLRKIVSELPVITGSEGDAFIGIMPDDSSRQPVFPMTKRNAPKYYFDSREELYHANYLIVISGRLRGREMRQTLREVSKVLFRLAEKCLIDDISVTVSSQDGKKYTFCNSEVFY